MSLEDFEATCNLNSKHFRLFIGSMQALTHALVKLLLALCSKRLIWKVGPFLDASTNF